MVITLNEFLSVETIEPEKKLLRYYTKMFPSILWFRMHFVISERTNENNFISYGKRLYVMAYKFSNF